ncbi:glycosyltransferase family 4 protein [Acidaminococcus massiliensis]|uniref:glycosyltransferase family 4 protein n=1 Tax=Acidaminococcus massiliensis TaxID=1852375 RepID=UPI00248D55FB|nr:glycosyltransferase family 4 protein [Acidaminococcus massiliensis]
MKIVHLCLASFYPDGYSYQENLLPKFHKELGLDVEVIASTQSFDKDGRVCYLKKTGSYLNEFGIKVTRLPYIFEGKFWHKIRKYKDVFKTLQSSAPDIIFIHGIQFADVPQVIKYKKKNPHVIMYADNHADFTNSATNWLSKEILHKIIWRHYAQLLVPYVNKFYGVLPVRVDFLKNVYRIPSEKCDLLVMGADDDLVMQAKQSNIRRDIRKKYGISENHILIVTGGKIDQWKTQTLLLMKAVHEINSKRIKLIIFGSVVPELKKEFNKLVDNNKIYYLGWVPSNETYNYFEASDLGIFPGRHSVLWEQAVGQGLPLIVKDWEGTHHVDLGGNVIFLKNDSIDEIKHDIEFILNNKDAYQAMKKVAKAKGMLYFSYKEIAKRSINL